MVTYAYWFATFLIVAAILAESAGPTVASLAERRDARRN